MMLPVIATPAQAATNAQINQAIQDGLAWLAIQQNSSNGMWNAGYPLADTGAALLAFENEGNFPGGGAQYSAVVEKGLNFMFNYCYKTSISNQTYGYSGRNDNPDSNGNGQGIYFSESSQMYETGIVMQAIVASNTPDRLVPAGNCAGMTYKQVMTDIVDWVAWGQVDGSYGRGGWYYYAFNNGSGYSDNSAAQWPVLGLIAAQNWGIYAPQWVKSEMNYWVTFIQGTDGSSGYNLPNDWVSNVAKTGGLLVEMYYLGDDMNTLRAQRAINYINANWNQAPSGWWGNKGQPYAMFAVFKGLELMKVPTMSNAPANPDTQAGDWWGDYAHYLVTTQSHPAAGQGYWGGYYYWNWGLATPWYIVILQATVFPVTVKISVPDSACNITGYDASLQYAVERFPANGTVKVYKDGALYDTVTLTNFQGTGQKGYTIAPDSNGVHNWKAVLDVTGGGISAHAEATDAGTVYDTPQVSGIPDQTRPFAPINLDNYRTCSSGDTYPVTWSATGVPAGWSVTIVKDVATVTAPDDATSYADITFVATAHWQGIDCTGSDTARFSVNRPPVADAGKKYGIEEYEVLEGGSVIVDGSKSYDPDGDPITYAWDLNGDGVFETPGVTAVFSALNLDGPGEAYVRLQVCDSHGACDLDIAEVEVENVAPTVNAGPDVTNSSGQVHQLTATYSDPGVLDTHTATIDWGDGSPVQNLGTVQGGTINASHQYFVPGNYIIEVCVTDDDGGKGCDTVVKTVKRLVVKIDIKPGSFPNSINLGNNGNVPVGVFTGTYEGVSFDTTTIDRNSLLFAGAPDLGIGKSPQDLDADGDMDMVFHFDTSKLNLTSASTEATLTGKTTGNIYFEGTDSVRIVPPKK